MMQTMTMTSIQNSSGFGIIIENVKTLNLDTCSFTNNGYKSGRNLAIWHLELVFYGQLKTSTQP